MQYSGIIGVQKIGVVQNRDERSLARLPMSFKSSFIFWLLITFGIFPNFVREFRMNFLPGRVF